MSDGSQSDFQMEDDKNLICKINSGGNQYDGDAQQTANTKRYWNAEEDLKLT